MSTTPFRRADGAQAAIVRDDENGAWYVERPQGRQPYFNRRACVAALNREDYEIDMKMDLARERARTED